MKSANILLVLITFTSYSVARVINIPAEYTTIQAGIEASISGDTILVQPGIYYQNINFNGRNIVVGSLFLINGDTSSILSTVIDAGASGSVVTFNHAENNQAMLTGFVLRNGSASLHGFGFFGGGIYCESTSAKITNNFIIENNANMMEGHGGGIACVKKSNCVISFNRIIGNVSGDGGGIYCNDSPIQIISNIISHDTAYFSGEGGWGGGGIYCVGDSAPVIIGNIISENVGELQGGGIYCGGYSNPIIVNNVIFGNMTYGSGGGIGCGNSSPRIVNSILWGNIPNQFNQPSVPLVSYCDIQGGWNGEGNIDMYPSFRNTVLNDFHLMSELCGDSINSPCIDAGDPNILDSYLDCFFGLGSTHSDISAFGGENYITGIFENDLGEVPDKIGFLKNYPNPFNSATTIILNGIDRADISIYDIEGRLITTLHASGGQAVWDASGRSSGLFFAQVNREKKSAIKMTLVK